MQMRVVPWTESVDKKKQSLVAQSVKLFLNLDKWKTRRGNSNYSSLCFFTFTWPTSNFSPCDSSGSVVSLDLFFMPANTSFLSKNWKVDQDKFSFSQEKITLEVVKLLLSWLTFFFSFFSDLLWLHAIKYKSGRNSHAELSLAVPCADW